MNRTTAITAAGALVLTVAGGVSALAFTSSAPAAENPAPVVQTADPAANPEPIVVVVPADGVAPEVTINRPATVQDAAPAYPAAAYEEGEYEDGEYEDEEYEEEEYEEYEEYEDEEHDEDEYEDEEYGDDD